MATSVEDFLKQNPQYVGRSNMANRTAAAPVAKPRSGLAGFIEGIVRDVAHPVGYILDADIGNPVRQLAAQATGNKLAYRNADKRADNNLNIGKDKSFASGLGRWAGNSAQLALTLAAPEANSIKGAAAVGAGFGGSSALAHDRPWEDVATQAALGGLTGGALKGATTVGGKLLSKGGAEAGTLEQAGGTIRQNVVNPKTTASVFGAEDDKAITQTVNKYVKGFSAGGKYKNLGPAMRNIDSDIQSQLSGISDTVPKTTFISSLRKQALDAGEYIDATNPAHLKTLDSQISRFTKNLPDTLTATDVYQVKKGLSGALGKGFGSAASGESNNVLKQAQYDLWSQMDDHLTGIAPEVKNLTVAQSQLIKSAKGLQQAANKTAGVPILGIKSKGLESGIQGARDISGRLLENTGRGLSKALGGGAEAVSRTPRMGLAAYPVTGPLSVRSPEAAPVDMGQEDTTLYGPEAMQGAEGAGMLPMEEPQQSAYTLQQALADLQAHPDAKSRKNIMDYYDFVQSAEKAQGGGAAKALNSTAAGNVTDLQNGIANIKQLSQQFSSSGANNPLIGKIRGLNPYDTEAQGLQANIARVKQVIGKALEGGVLRKEDEVKYAKILPTLNDTDAVAQRKIQAITDDLERKLYLYQENLGQGGGGYDLASVLQQAQGAY